MAVKKRKKKNDGLLHRYRMLPHELHSRKLTVRNRAQRLLTITVCIPLVVASIIYISHWLKVKTTIENDNKEYSALYSPSETDTFEVPVATQTSVPFYYSPVPSSTIVPQVTNTIAPISTCITTAVPTTTQTAKPTSEPTLTPSYSPLSNTEVPIAPVAEDELLIVNSTPNTDTVIYAIQTPPPVQDSFQSLISVNAETIGYLTIGSQISLPVVQKYNDNEYYLNHNLRGEESEGGTLFLDGSNLLIPEDPVLLIYGHNMKNGTMFQPLTCFERIDYLRSNPVIHFDTIYDNRLYMPVAVFTESVNTDSDGYVNIRQFTFDETQWELYVLKLEKLSIYDMEIDAKYGDHLLLLVTCEYTHDNGRLIVVFRELRSDENIETARMKLSTVNLK